MADDAREQPAGAANLLPVGPKKEDTIVRAVMGENDRQRAAGKAALHQFGAPLRLVRIETTLAVVQVAIHHAKKSPSNSMSSERAVDAGSS